MPREIRLVKSVPKNELMELYKKETNARIKPRLLAIIHLYEGKTGKDTSKLVKTSYPSLIRWVERWNRNGYKGLIPNFTGGYKPQLDSAAWDKNI